MSAIRPTPPRPAGGTGRSRKEPQASGHEPSEPGRRVTIGDIARSLGVSSATVSLALNGKGTLSASTRERVIAEAARTGYAANPLAVGLRVGRSAVLGLSMRSLDTYGSYRPAGVDHFSRMASAAAFAALDRGFALMLIPQGDRGPGIEAPLWLDGYVVEDPRRSDPFLSTLMNAGIPVVTIGWDPARKSRTAWVSTAVRPETTRLLHLLELRGAGSIAFVSGLERNSWNVESERAYRNWCRGAGRPEKLLFLAENSGESGGAEIAGQLLGGEDPPGAIFCQSGRVAAGAAATAIESGLRIPEDLMVVAGNDAEQARHFHPGITSIDLQAESLGREAVELLADIVSGTAKRKSVLVGGKLLERGSTDRADSGEARAARLAHA